MSEVIDISPGSLDSSLSPLLHLPYNSRSTTEGTLQTTSLGNNVENLKFLGRF